MKRGTDDSCSCSDTANNRLRTQVIWPGAIALVLFHLSAVGEGFRNPPPGTFNLGRAGGRIAHVDDASSVVQNPANMVDLTGAEVQLSPSIVYIRADYESPSGVTAETEEPWKLLPNAFATVPLADGNVALGLGVTVPYGLGNEWDETSSAFDRPFGPWRYQSPYSAKLTTVNVAPTVAAKLSEALRVGAGVDVMWSELTLKQYYPWFLGTGNLADPDGRITTESEGTGVSGHLGVTLQLTERQRVALTYRLPLDINYKGDFQADNVPAALGGGVFRTEFKTQIRFPTVVAAGYGINLTERLRLEADVEWLQFSRFEDLPLMVANGLPGLPASINEDWRDTWTLGISGDYRLGEHWVVRAGYQFYQSPIPDSTFSPAIPDADQHVLTFGIGYNYKRHFLEAAYGADFYNTRQIADNQNPAFNGTYNFTVHLFSLSYRFVF